MRLLQPRPCLGADPHRVLQGGRNLPKIGFMNSFRMTIALRTRKNKTPPGWNPRAFALPREIGLTDLRGRIRSMDENQGEQMPCIARARQRIAISARRQTDFGEVMQHD